MILILIKRKKHIDKFILHIIFIGNFWKVIRVQLFI